MTTLAFDVLWRDRGAAKGLANLGKGADQAHGKLSKFTGIAGKGLKSVGVAAAGLAAGGAAALGALGVAGAAMGVKVASGNEQAKISFTTMLGSAKKAGAFLKDLQKFAAETPFEFPELQTAASSLISAGINADKVIPIMRTLGDVTSGMGTGSEGVQRATIALQQMSAAGRITAEDLNQLRDAGIPVYDLLAKATGKSKEEVVKLAQAGKLGKKELGQMMEALESGKGLERFNGLMEKQSKSLAGTWSTLKDTIGQGLGGVMANALPIMKQGIQGISSLATSAFAWVDKNKGSISSLFKTAGSSLKAFGSIISGVFSAFVSSTGDGTKSFKSFADYIATNQESIIRGFVSAGKGALLFGRTLATSASAGLRGFAFLLDGVTTATQGILAAVGSMAAGSAAAFGWIPGIGPKLKGAVTAFNKFSTSAVEGSRKAADGARGLADGIDKNVVPSIDKGAKALDKFGNKEIVKARQRDQVAKLSIALRSIPKEKRAKILTIANTKGATAAWKEIAKVKNKSVITKATGKGVNTVKEIDAAIKKLKSKAVRAQANTAGKGAVNDLDAAIKKLKSRRVHASATTSGKGGVDSLRNALGGLKSKTVYATIISRKMKADGGYIDPVSRASGGMVPGRGGPREDNIAGFDRATRVQTAWVSAREFVVNAAQTKANRAQIETINAGGKWDLVPRRARGGLIGRGDYVSAGSFAAASVVNINLNARTVIGDRAGVKRLLEDMKRNGELRGILA